MNNLSRFGQLWDASAKFGVWFDAGRGRTREPEWYDRSTRSISDGRPLGSETWVGILAPHSEAGREENQQASAHRICCIRAWVPWTCGLSGILGQHRVGVDEIKCGIGQTWVALDSAQDFLLSSAKFMAVSTELALASTGLRPGSTRRGLLRPKLFRDPPSLGWIRQNWRLLQMLWNLPKIVRCRSCARPNC